jgi:hypothetical protein
MAQGRSKSTGAGQGRIPRHTSGAAHYLTGHDEIRRWAEDRKASPACVRNTRGSNDIGIIRLDFAGYGSDASLEHIEWDQWFEKFDENNLALLVQEETASGTPSNFNKLVGREAAEAREHGIKTARHRPASGASSGSQRRQPAQASKTKPTLVTTGSKRGASRSAEGRSPASRAGTARDSRQRMSPTTKPTTKKVESIDSRAKSRRSGQQKKPAA